MPFDAAGFPPERGEPGRAAPSDNEVTAVIIVLAFSLLVMPISLAALVDVFRYLRGH